VLDRVWQVNSERIVLRHHENAMKGVGVLMGRKVSVNLDLVLIGSERSEVVRRRYSVILLVGIAPGLSEHDREHLIDLGKHDKNASP
jgi:hypothetical protein